LCSNIDRVSKIEINQKGMRMDVSNIPKKHEKEIERFGVKRIGVFGSFAIGEQKETNDIGIVVEFENPNF